MNPDVFFETFLILPGDLEYEETIENISLFWHANQGAINNNNGNGCWVFGNNGLPRWVNQKDLDQYLEDGEYSERVEDLNNIILPFEIEDIYEPLDD